MARLSPPSGPEDGLPSSPERLLAECRSLRTLLAASRRRLKEVEETFQASLHGYLDTLARHADAGETFANPLADVPFRSLVEAMDVGVGLLSADGTILYANRALTGLLGAPPIRLAGVSLRQFVSAEDVDRLRRLLERGLRHGVDGDLALRTASRSSLRAWVRLSPAPVHHDAAICLNVIPRRGAGAEDVA